MKVATSKYYRKPHVILYYNFTLCFETLKFLLLQIKQLFCSGNSNKKSK